MKKQQPQISEDRIVEASWELLKEGEIEKFSMRKLADRLGIQAPSLYWHFKSKQDLYQRLAGRIAKKITEEFRAEGDWRQQLAELAAAMRNVLERYPCATQLMMMTLPHEPDNIRLTNRMLLCLEPTPLAPEQRFQAILTLTNYVFHFVLDNEQHQRAVSALVQEKETVPYGEMSELLDGMSEEDAGLFRKLFKNGLFELMGTDKAFDFGVKLILLGIEQVIEEQEAQSEV
ncbi:TetR/AcrR family transcriptional regulator [Saccharibacillus alkalitolerans]|uniref:TetR family transcriptional regulator n=1 Tax=Saccharibacillus alkalitolerans TaxID=2705290 RepID=A0ABX0F7Y5_9BACL|nr:TetR/AcrR family transcriptional regulator C-terminal domain-containing protein [Saccharibacillus alkalitolerans]NGZ77063.1 TetR family transcriptional regulator [Saccharibacillus alkalitolerans]